MSEVTDKIVLNLENLSKKQLIDKVKLLASSLELATSPINRAAHISTDGNYSVLSLTHGCPYFGIAYGNRAYCIGYAEGWSSNNNHRCVVSCGTVIIWPEEQYFDMIEEPIE